MDIQNVLASVQSAVSMIALQKSLGQDAQSMATLVSDMKVQTPAVSAPPHTGSIDVRA